MFAERIGTPVAHDLVTEPERKEWEHGRSYNAGVKMLFNTQWWVISCLLPNLVVFPPLNAPKCFSFLGILDFRDFDVHIVTEWSHKRSVFHGQ